MKKKKEKRMKQKSTLGTVNVLPDPYDSNLNASFIAF